MPENSVGTPELKSALKAVSVTALLVTEVIDNPKATAAAHNLARMVASSSPFLSRDSAVSAGRRH